MRRPIILIALSLALMIFIWDSIAGYDSDIMEGFSGQTVTIYGKVDEAEYKDQEYYQLILDEIQIENQDLSYDRRVLVSVFAELDSYMALPGSLVKIRGEVAIPSERKNPGCFDYRKYLKSLRVRTVISTSSVETISPPGRLMTVMNSMKASAVQALQKGAGGDRAGIVIGMIFGSTEYISDECMEVFRKGGTAHILAVSGLHVGIVYGCLLKLRRRKKSLPADIIAAAALVFYAALCSFTPSVTRAVLMILIHMLGGQLKRRYDFTCSACAAMIAVLLINPYEIYSAGFQMSFLAAFTIAVILPRLEKRIKGMMLPIVGIQLGLLPYTAYTFNYISLAAFICNIPIAFLAGLIIPLGLALIPLSAAGIDGAIVPLLDILSGIMIRCNELTYAGGLLTFDCISPPAWLVAGIYFMGFFMLSEAGEIARIRRDRKKICSVIIVCIMVCIGTAASFSDGFGSCEITFVDVGQGDCIHVREGGVNILVDGGGSASYSVGEKTLKPYLLKNGAGHIDLAIATHLHMDHYQGICELSKVYRIDALAVYEGNREREEEIRKECNVGRIIYLRKGDVIDIGDDGYIKVLGPEIGSSGDDEDENFQSLVLRICIKEVSVLVTADIDCEGEKKLMKGNRSIDCTVLKVAHHGSMYSTSDEFLEKASPQLAVISVGKNSYGHPSAETVEKLEASGMPVYRTDKNGAVGIDVDRMKIESIR